MKLIFIHGHIPQGYEALELKKRWTDALKIGLSRSGLSMPLDKNDIIFSYYGQELGALATSANWALEQTVKESNISLRTETRIIHDFLLEVARNAGLDIELIASRNEIPLIHRSYLNWTWIRLLLETLDKHAVWSQLSIRRMTYEIYCYLSNPVFRDTVHDVVLNQMDREAAVVVSHGLGSIVAYHVLLKNPQLHISRHFSLGNPMGLQAVSACSEPIRFASSLKGEWHNFYDQQDPIALNEISGADRQTESQISNHGGTYTRTENHHDIGGYLNNQHIAREIYDALTHSAPRSSSNHIQHLKFWAIISPSFSFMGELELLGCIFSFF